MDCVVRIAHVFLFCVGWGVSSFQGVKGFIKLCSFGQHHKANTCLCDDLLQTYAYYLVKTMGEKLFAFPHVLIVVMSLGVIIGVVNG